MAVEIEFSAGLQAQDLQYLQDIDINRDTLSGWFEALAREPLLTDFADQLKADVCIRFCDEGESAELNGVYRGRERPTNILSFPADIDAPGVSILGDLLICLPVIRTEAVAQAKPLPDHLRHLMVHGVLHLLGFDHVEEVEAGEMEQLERVHLQRYGVPDPY